MLEVNKNSSKKLSTFLDPGIVSFLYFLVLDFYSFNRHSLNERCFMSGNEDTEHKNSCFRATPNVGWEGGGRPIQLRVQKSRMEMMLVHSGSSDNLD